LTRFTHLFLKARNSLVICFIVFNSLFLFPVAARAEDSAPSVTTIVTQGGDDVSYQIPLTVSVVYDGVTYQNVYATTNSVITFGSPDGTYWNYPLTPSISIESRDWWALPDRMPDTHFIINVSDGGFQVDGAYRPYGSMSGEVTSIVITAQIQTGGTVAYTYAVNGPLYGGERTGARLTDGTVVPLEQANIIQVEEAPILEPTPVEPEPVIPEPEPTPDPVVEPEPDTTPPVVPDIVVVQPPIIIPFEPPLVEEIVAEEPPVLVEEPPVIVEELPTEPETIPVEEEQPPIEEEVPLVEEEAPIVEEEPEVIQVDEVELETLAPETPVELSNGVVVTAEVAIAVQLLQDPVAMLQEIFTNPVAALDALGSVGADMTEEVREESEKVIVAAVIAGNIATQAAATAGAVSAYRRKP
jgi:hypothetical protein